MILGVQACAPIALINVKFQQLSKETRILKISQYLAELSNCNYFKTLKKWTFGNDLAPFAPFTT